MPAMDPVPALQQILFSLPAPTQDFLLRPTETAHLTLALSTPPKTHVHSIATQTKSCPLPDSLSHTLYHTLPSSNLGFQINVRAGSHATFRTYRDDEKGIFLRVANYDDTLHIACTRRLSGAVRRSYQAFISSQFKDPTFAFHVVEIGRCPLCGRRELCACNGYAAEFNGVFEGLGRAVWHREDRDDVVDVMTRSQVTETLDLTLASGLRQRALGECLTNVPVQLSRLALPRGRMIIPAAGTVQQVQEEMQTRYEEETRRKIEERKMRNRRAAVQSNVKKKLMVERMKKELVELAKRKDALERRQREVQQENQRLKALVLKTGDLDDFLVDGFVFA